MDFRMMNQIMIMGCSGSGKSTLSIRLSEVLSIPVIHLDKHYWRPDWVSTPDEEWHKIVQELIMENNKLEFTNIDEYISLQADNIKEILSKVREVVRVNAPEATEKISYQMPTFFYNGNLVHFAAFKNHIGFYPAPSGIVEFRVPLDF